MRREIVLRGFALLGFLAVAGCCRSTPGNVFGDGGGDGDVVDAQEIGDSPDSPDAIDSPDSIDAPDVPDGASPSCAPQDVHDSSCFVCDAYLFLGAFWDGRECYELWGCSCDGPDCASGFPSLDACNAAMAGCDASVCAATGGTWYPAPEGGCGISCGAPDPFDCLVAGAACNCGPGRTFASGTGCQPDATCTPTQTCVATGGTWDSSVCSFTCGVADPNAPACVPGACNCGPTRTADSTGACVTDASCPPSTADRLCASTGGTWYPPTSGCVCTFDCGVASSCGCSPGGCDCGPFRNWDTTQGCVHDPGCENRGVGQSCEGGATCRAGLVCCYPCGIPGCTNQCTTPCCPTSSACVSGCYLYP